MNALNFILDSSVKILLQLELVSSLTDRLPGCAAVNAVIRSHLMASTGFALAAETGV